MATGTIKVQVPLKPSKTAEAPRGKTPEEATKPQNSGAKTPTYEPTYETVQKQMRELADEVSTDFHAELFQLLGQFQPAELARFVELWSKVDPTMRKAVVAFVVMGEDPDGAFLKYLDQNTNGCQEAVDLAFAAHIDSLRDLGKSLSDAEQVIPVNRS